MNTRENDMPSTMVDRPGTYHGMSALKPVQPHQNIPTTRKGPATIDPIKRSSGGGKPFHFGTRTR